MAAPRGLNLNSLQKSTCLYLNLHWSSYVSQEGGLLKERVFSRCSCEQPSSFTDESEGSTLSKSHLSNTCNYMRFPVVCADICWNQTEIQRSNVRDPTDRRAAVFILWNCMQNSDQDNIYLRKWGRNKTAMRMMQCERAWRPLLGELFFFLKFLIWQRWQRRQKRRKRRSNVAENGISWLLAGRNYHSTDWD